MSELTNKFFLPAFFLPAAFFALVLITLLAPNSSIASPFEERIAPFAKKYCHDCHNKQKAKGELDLTRYAQDLDVAGDFRRWNSVVEFIRHGEMPPEESRQPTLEERNDVVAAIESMLIAEAKKNAGDPGVVLPRRLSNTEYDLSIRDLTGVAILATSEFPVDPAGGEGFDNTGEALGMTPSLLNKYLGAAQFASEHLVLKRNGIAFSPFPVTSYNERKKLTEQAIIDFYRNHDVRIGDYLEAAWRYRHRGDTDQHVSPATWAERNGLSGRYLTLLVKTLNEAKTTSGYLKQIGMHWDSLPSPRSGEDKPPEVKDLEQFIVFAQSRMCPKEPALINSNAGNWPIGHLALRAKVAAARDKFDPSVFRSRQLLRFQKLPTNQKEIPKTGLTIYLRVDTALDANAKGIVVLHRPVFSKLDHPPRNDSDIKNGDVVTLRETLKKAAPEVAQRLKFGQHPRGATLDADSFAVEAPCVIEIPLDQDTVAACQGKQLLVECELDGEHSPESAVYLQQAIGKMPGEPRGDNVEFLIRPESQLAKEVSAAGDSFCNTFPNRFFYVDPNRGLAAGFHLVEGFFRDDQPLMEKVLSDAERTELDGLWKELEFVTQSVEVLLRGFVWFERAERNVLHDKRFDFLRSEDPRLVEDEMLSKFERLYLEKLGVKLLDDAVLPDKPSSQFDMIHGFFQQVRTGLSEYEQMRQRAEQPALADLERLAQRAFGRPLRPTEVNSFRALYDKLRKQGDNVEDALRGVFTAILMSPDFFYNIPSPPSGEGIYSLSNDALARRLSYFLWSSIPDDELFAASRSGKIQDDATLRAQTRRMLQDPKVESFAREFFGQWLRYRDYLAKDPNSGESTSDNAELRRAMFEEPTRLITRLIQEDQRVDELLHGDSTLVNERLAKFYGGVIESQFRQSSERSDWRRVEGLRGIGRGGLFGMPVILSKNSAGQRTSPVKRGFWVVHHLLGQHFPPPPADVPELPKSEQEANTTIRELLASHVANKQCAICHVHFDGFGLTMEGFDVMGRSRTKDSAGRTVDATGILPGGTTAAGISDLIHYVEKHRQADFERTLCRKFLGYALGRSVILADQPLLQEMEKRLREERRFSVLFESVVLSPQFRRQRGRDYIVTSP